MLAGYEPKLSMFEFDSFIAVPTQLERNIRTYSSRFRIFQKWESVKLETNFVILVSIIIPISSSNKTIKDSADRLCYKTFFSWAIPCLFLIYFHLFQYHWKVSKSFQWPDSNHGSLVKKRPLHQLCHNHCPLLVLSLNNWQMATNSNFKCSFKIVQLKITAT